MPENSRNTEGVGQEVRKTRKRYALVAFPMLVLYTGLVDFDPLHSVRTLCRRKEIGGSGRVWEQEPVKMIMWSVKQLQARWAYARQEEKIILSTMREQI
jgi:hypothetical protein